MKSKQSIANLLALGVAPALLLVSAAAGAQGKTPAPTASAPAAAASSSAPAPTAPATAAAPTAAPAPTDPAATPAPTDPAAAPPPAEPAAPPPPPTPEPAATSPSVSLSTGDAAAGADTPSEPEASGKDRGAFVAGGKFGGLMQLSGFGPNVTGALEIGYILPFLKRGLGVMVDASYAAPVVSGTEQDPRVQGGSYEWNLVQKQLTIFPFVTYRYTGLGKIVPYAGVGPRIVMLEGVTYGTVAAKPLLETRERSTKVGVGVPLGAEYLIGPGAALGEFLFAYNSIDHKSTGNASLTGFTLWLGYRFLL